LRPGKGKGESGEARGFKQTNFSPCGGKKKRDFQEHVKEGKWKVQRGKKGSKKEQKEEKVSQRNPVSSQRKGKGRGAGEGFVGKKKNFKKKP